jgi:uncharacterized protein (TIGR02453 family)
MTTFDADFLDFFKELAANNNKDWFDLNRKRYEQKVKLPFQQFVQHLIHEIAKQHPVFKDLTPSECIFRINRDIRFSKDKSPYKMMTSAVIAPNGKKSRAIHGVYFELGPEAVRVYGGIYEIDKDDLLVVREGIAAHLDNFRSLVNAPEFVNTYGEIRGEKNRIMPAHLKEAAQAEPLICNKQWYFMTEFPAELVLSPNLSDTILECFRIGEPLELFFNQFIDRS